MINCNDFRNLAGEFLEGAERPDLSAHLSARSACRNLIDDLQAISATAASLVDLADLEPSAGLWAVLRERAEAEGLFSSGPSASVPGMTCKEFEAFAGEFLEGAERPDLSAHLSACSACGNLIDDLRAISATAASLVDLADRTNLEPSAGLWARLRERAETEGLFSGVASVGVQGMSCEEFEAFAGDVLGGESNPEAFEHLYACANCREFLHELDAIARAARDLPVYEPQPQLWNRLRAAARAEDLWQEDSWWERWLVPQPVLASGLAAAVLVFGVFMVSLDTLGSYGNISGPNAIDLSRTEMITEAEYAMQYGIHLLRMERAVLDEGADINDRMIDLVEKPMNTVDRAIEKTQLALSENPRDEMVREELNRLFKQKATVLAAMTELSWQEYGE